MDKNGFISIMLAVTTACFACFCMYEAKLASNKDRLAKAIEEADETLWTYEIQWNDGTSNTYKIIDDKKHKASHLQFVFHEFRNGKLYDLESMYKLKDGNWIIINLSQIKTLKSNKTYWSHE